MVGPLLHDGTSLATGDGVGDTPPAPARPAFDPGEHTVAEVETYLDTVEGPGRLGELARLAYLEEVGQGRVSLLAALENYAEVERLRRETENGIDPDEHSVAEVKAYVERHRDDRLEDRLTLLRSAEESGKARKTLLAWLDDELIFVRDAVPEETTEEPTSDENTEPAGDGAGDDTTTEES